MLELKPTGYITHIQKSIKGQRVLDVGCCATHKQNNLKRHLQYKKAASKIIGLDIHTEYLKLGMEKHPGVELYNCDITDKLKVGLLVPVLGQFDHVIATDLIEHVTNTKALLDNLHLFMTPGASLYLTTPNARSPYCWQVFLGWTNGGIVNADHICFFEIQTLTEALKQSGFKVHEVYYCVHSLCRDSAKRFNLRWAPWMGFKLYVVARKVE